LSTVIHQSTIPKLSRQDSSHPPEAQRTFGSFTIPVLPSSRKFLMEGQDNNVGGQAKETPKDADTMAD
jgi:hypothetical protein